MPSLKLLRTGKLLSLCLFCALLCDPSARAETRSFSSGTLIIPMDLTYQDHGMFQAYGLLFQLLRQGVPVAWAIDMNKTWHAAPCNQAGDLCTWDCAAEGANVKCPYPTASPDFIAEAQVIWDGESGAAAGTAIAAHGYRGGPFLVAAEHRAAALPIIDAWNDPSKWAANPWATRTVFHAVTVHAATADFSANVAKDMLVAPTIAIFSDGNENIATAYLRAAGIPQSNGLEFPSAKCGASNCGPGTANPDMLTVRSVMGDAGTCESRNNNHKNGALFTPEGLPAYCQIMSMHWNVTDRETVECGDGPCPASVDLCTGQPITYHGHEVVAEVRSFLKYPVHFFAECQAVNAYENTVPNSAWPYLDDVGRDGHFLTTRGTPPACPCAEAGFSCVAGGCGGTDCCLPTDVKEKGAGYLIAAQPSTVKVLRPNIAYNQLDGAFDTVGGSEPAYNLSSYLGTQYKNGREVTFITGPSGPGNQDVWMTGYADGVCDIGHGYEGPNLLGGLGTIHTPLDSSCGVGKVSYLGGHSYSTTVPLSSNSGSQGVRLFLNALFEADCVTPVGQPAVALGLTGELVVAAKALPVERTFQVTYSNSGKGAALDAQLRFVAPAEVVVADAGGGTVAGDATRWSIGAISGVPVQAGDPAASGRRSVVLRLSEFGDRQVTVGMTYRVGVSAVEAAPQTFTIRVLSDRDGDGVPDETDPAPDDASVGGPSVGGPSGGGSSGGGGGSPASGCSCQEGGTEACLMALLAAMPLLRRRRAVPVRSAAPASFGATARPTPSSRART